jgi:hypothetical protein
MMQPTRAAWLFAAGLVWLVFRGLLLPVFPFLGTEHAVRQGGWLLVIPTLSAVASFAVPLFFYAFLHHHRFDGQRALRAATLTALVVSLISFAVVALSWFDAVRAAAPRHGIIASSAPWAIVVVPAVFIIGIFGFLVAFAVQCRCAPELRRSAAIAAVGALVPILLIAGWALHSSGDGWLPWFPSVSRSIPVRVIGLAAAGTLLLFLENFAVSYRAEGASRRE